MPGLNQGCACPVRPLRRTAITHRAAIALLVLISTLLALVAPANAEQRIALVVTNQAYTQAGAALTNTHRDGDLVRAALERVGFKVTVVRDTPNETALLSAFGTHVQRLADAGPDAIGFVYYSGHGAADRPDGANYLIPTGAPITHAAQLPLMAVRLDKITETLARVGRINFVVFDACRNVPLQRADKDLSFKGWAPVKEQSGLLVAYATEPGNVAVDQSIYARALAEEIVQPGREASSAFRAVARRVLQETANKQAPQYLDRRLHDFEFAAVARPPEPGPRPQIAPAPQPAPAAPAAIAPPPPAPSNQAAVVPPPAPQPAPSGRQPPYSHWDCKSEASWCKVGLEMRVLPTGSYMRGSTEAEIAALVKTYGANWYKNEGPQRRVTIGHAIALAKYETTFELWDLCVAEKGCKQSPKDEGWGRGNRPVINVSWDEITTEFLPWLNRKLGIAPTAPDRYRLPNEAEWEYAARAGTTGDYSFPGPITADKANYDATKTHAGSPKGTWRQRTVAVDDGGFPANPWGLAHVHGNTWEWVQDCFAEGYGSAPTDGAPVESSNCVARVLRGGSWSDIPQDLRSAIRSWNQPDYRFIVIGFRLARTLPPTP